jgi:hypothetical protein
MGLNMTNGLHGSGLGLNSAQRSGLGAQCSGSGLVQMTAIKREIEKFRAFSGHSFFAKKKLFVIVLILCS